jgi:glycosyltransferase involved in cell wall biosynthesis
MILNRDIVIVGQQPWDVEIGSNCKNIALEFSNNNRVLYVNSPLDRITLIRNGKDAKIKQRLEVIRGKKNGLLKIKENLWNLFPDQMIESINWIKNDKLYDFFNINNNKKFASSISKTIQELKFKNIILFNDGDIFRSFYLKELLHPEISIYYSRDYLLATDYYKYHGAKLEPLLISKSTICLANSSYLTTYCKKYNPHSYYVGQGCDQWTFTDSNLKNIPSEIKDIPNPIIGYVGVLYTSRLDIEILIYIAKSNPAWQLVLIGPEDENFKKSELHQIKNVHFLGAKHPEELVSYINAFNVCINPQILNELTIGNYPRKVDEYLIMGKPVVATKTAAMDIFNDFVYLADSKEEYPALISKALQEDTAEAKANRKTFAGTHTWKNSVNEIYKAIITATPRKKENNYA